MRKGILGSLVTLLAGTGLAVAQTPVDIQTTAASDAPPAAATAKAPASIAAPVPGPAGSPYWPNPSALMDCAAPGCGVIPQAPGCLRDTHGSQGELFWASAEYLLWWVKDGPLATPLVTTSSPGFTGVLGSGDTTTVFGGSGLDFRAASGARFSAGFWFGQGSDWGLEGSGFFLEKRPADFSAASATTGTPLLARPIVNAVTGAETSQLIAAPGQFSGNFAVNADSGLYGWEINVVNRFYADSPVHIDLLGGFRYVHLNEDIEMTQNSVILPGGTASFAGAMLTSPTGVTVFDQFTAVNEFYGGQLGMRFEYGGDRWYVNALGKIALGSTHEVVTIGGASTTGIRTGNPVVVPGGLLAVSSNSGRFANDEFAVVPEISLNVGYKITPMCRVFVGYSFLYWSEVARPGDQISRVVNPGVVPTSALFATTGGPALPAPSMQRTEFWAQGVNFGLEFRY